jgi:outer membrane protein OmpA-like peptidoglycan-associated protein
MAPDGKTLYFIRGKRTRQGKEQDIYKSELKENGEWTEPVKLSSTINTPYREESVFIHPDGRTLYFSSNGHPGMGGLDIFYSRKQEDGSWSEPKNLGYPINTHDQENSLLVSPDGTHAYFGSDREGGYGGLDLYRFELPDSVRADPVTYLRGKLVDAETGEPLRAEFELKDLSNGELVTRSSSDKKNGTFLVPLPTGREYALSVDRKGYLFHSEHFMLKQKGGGTSDPVKKNIELQPIDTGRSVVLENVFFETAKYNLKKESRVELDKLYRFLKANPSVRIEIQGHTDSVGTARDNQILSENRAEAVYDYLEKKGIDPSRMVAKGYGERRPIADNSTPEGRARNRRTAYKIIGK